MTENILAPSHIRSNQELADKFSLWLKAMHYSENTIRAYGALTGGLCAFLGPRSLLEVKHQDVRDYITNLYERGNSQTTMSRQLSGLRNFFGFLQLGGVVNVNVARLLKARKVPRRLPRSLSIEEVRRMIEAAKSPRDRALIEMFYGTGCRLAEIAGMRLEHMDLDAGVAQVIGKGDKERNVYFGQPAKEALLAYLGTRPDGTYRNGFLFRDDRPPRALHVCMAKPDRDIPTLYWKGHWVEGDPGVRRFKWLGKAEGVTGAQALEKLKALTANRYASVPRPDNPLGHRHIARIIKQVGQDAGIKDVHPHLLRHSFATHMLNQGADIRYIQEFLGHSSISTTMIYTHVTTTDMLANHQKFHPRG